jgi:methionine-rich copper-binding protein CopC
MSNARREKWDRKKPRRHRGKEKALCASVSLWFFLLVVFCPNAFPHASPVSYDPAASAVLDHAPTRIRIQFTERIEPKASSIAVFAPDGSHAEAKDGRPDGADGRVFTVSMRDAGSGSYTVSWQVVSEDDGHFPKGGFSFTVGKVGDAAARVDAPAEVAHSSTFSQAAAIGTELLGQSVFVGVLGLLALLWRPLTQRKTSEGQQSVF